MRVAILGAGAGGASAAVELAGGGHTVTLWSRSASTLEPFSDAGGISHTGVLGSGTLMPELMTDRLDRVLEDADVALVCLPTSAHVSLARALAEIRANSLPVVLNPGHTGGALAFRRVFDDAGLRPPPVAEFSTLTYVARKSAPDTVHTSGVAGRVWVACLPGDEAAVEQARELYPAAERARDVLATSLANVNMILHPPGSIMGASWIESTGGDFTFYVDGLSPGVGRIMERLDAERLAAGREFGLDLPDLFAEMQAIGTIEPDADSEAGLTAAVRSGTANSRIRAPASLRHRYFIEDFFFGLRPFLEFSAVAGVATPVARALMTLAEQLIDPDGEIAGRSARVMGIEGMDRPGLLQLVSG
jgi:opine dehydrogenase